MPVSEESFASSTALPVEDYFSEKYADARQKFRWAVQALSKHVPVELETLLVKSPDYTMDVAVVRGSQPKGLVVHSSGVHGVEGYAGSAIQTALLHGMACSRRRPEVTCVFVHAVNPFGMAHYRRVNENNVDLNRNALTEEGWKEVLARDANIAGYEDFRSFFVASCAPTWWSAHIGLWFQAVWMIARFGFLNLKRAMVAATYTNPKGIFFGGRELQESHRLLRAHMERNFGDVFGEEVAWVDVHTGLGPSGVDVLLCRSQDKSLTAGSFPGVGVQCFDDPTASGSQAAGYELTRGTMESLYEGVFRKRGMGVGALILTQEFGTVPGIFVARALILENRGYHFDSARHERWRQYTRDAFYVRTPCWKRAVLGRGAAVFEQACEVSAARSRGA